jgi:hypothetical protein
MVAAKWDSKASTAKPFVALSQTFADDHVSARQHLSTTREMRRPNLNEVMPIISRGALPSNPRLVKADVLYTYNNESPDGTALVSLTGLPANYHADVLYPYNNESPDGTALISLTGLPANYHAAATRDP